MERTNLFLASLGGLDSLDSLVNLLNLLNGLDDTDGNGLTYATDGDTTNWRVVSVGLNAHWLGRTHLHDC